MNVALRSAALRLKTKAEEALGANRLTNTRRRADMAANITKRAMRDAARAEVALKIADGDGVDALRGVVNLRMVETLEQLLEAGRYRAADPPRKMVESVSDDEAIEAVRFPVNDGEAVRRMMAAGIGGLTTLRLALREMCSLRGEPPQEDPVKALERKLVGLTGNDFFPTPVAVADRMVELAGLRPKHFVLEPSAGSGRLAEAARRAGCEQILCIELNVTLCELLEAKGFVATQGDFLDVADFDTLPERLRPDVILMNSPFSGGQDIEHVRHAFKHLRPGGTLVAILGQGAFFREDTKSRSFRAWLETVTVDHCEDLPPGTFNHSDVTQRTNVSAKLIRIRSHR